jgi:Alpha/beta hydrolase
VSELLGANTDVLDRKAEALSVDARRVQDIRTLAQRALGELQASWNGSDLLYLTQQWEQQASPLLGWASTSLDTCATELRAQSAAQQVTSSNSDGAAVGTPWQLISPQPTPPPGHGTPAGNALWWTSMTVLQQGQVIREHPEWIGNRDGVAFAARDQANRRLLTADRAHLMDEQRHLQGGTADFATRGPTTVDQDAVGRVKDKLSSIQAIQATLAGDGPRQLLLLDLGKERAEAAIANGDVDTAANVAVFVPGMTTTVNGFMKGYDQQMKHLQQRAESEDGRAHADQPAATTATVTWIGYQAPQNGDVLNPDKSVASLHLARTGAAQLAPFLQGIGAAREQDAHLTLLGHSYGSTTAGLALQQETGVDDAVFFGSPGLGTNRADDLDLAPGHAYYIEAGWDVVGDLGVFGMDPSHLSGIEHASARESTVLDPVTGERRTFAGVTGHNSYLVDDSTSQYNMSVIVAGEPGRRVYDRGEGVGDVLSWHNPETYR